MQLCQANEESSDGIVIEQDETIQLANENEFNDFDNSLYKDPKPLRTQKDSSKSQLASVELLQDKTNENQDTLETQMDKLENSQKRSFGTGSGKKRSSKYHAKQSLLLHLI